MIIDHENEFKAIINRGYANFFSWYFGHESPCWNWTKKKWAEMVSIGINHWYGLACDLDVDFKYSPPAIHCVSVKRKKVNRVDFFYFWF